MNGLYRLSQRTGRTAVAIVAALLVVTGIAWHGIAADQTTTAVHAATVTTPITHTIAGGRDSYADVVDGADDIKVETTDGRTMTAKLVGSDKPSDLALLKVSGTGFKAVAFGNSDTVKVGVVVLAVGNPLGVGQTVTMGIISGKGRSTNVGDGGYEDFLQTDAPINHGNSGGALVNTRDALVAINSQ